MWKIMCFLIQALKKIYNRPQKQNQIFEKGHNRSPLILAQ